MWKSLVLLAIVVTTTQSAPVENNFLEEVIESWNEKYEEIDCNKLFVYLPALKSEANGLPVTPFERFKTCESRYFRISYNKSSEVRFLCLLQSRLVPQ